MLALGPVDKANNEMYLELNFFKEQRTEKWFSGRERVCLKPAPFLHKLNHRPSQGMEAEKDREVQTSSLFIFSPDQILS